MKSIFDYMDYRDFLSDQYRSHKISNPQISLGQFAERLGLGHSNLKMILTKKRNLSLKNFLKISKVLKLSEPERNYLETLVLKDRLLEKSDQAVYTSKAKSIRKSAKLTVQVLSQKPMLKDELTLPALVYLSEKLKSTVFDPSEWIANLSAVFKIPPARSTQIMQTILNEKALVVANDEKTVHFAFSQITNKMSQKEYLQKWLKRSSEEIEKSYEDSSTFFTSSTIALSDETILEFKSDLKKLIEKYMAKGSPQTKAVRLVQSNIQMYKIT